MKSWKVQGYVQDSDEEDDSLEDAASLLTQHQSDHTQKGIFQDSLQDADQPDEAQDEGFATHTNSNGDEIIQDPPKDDLSAHLGDQKSSSRSTVESRLSVLSQTLASAKSQHIGSSQSTTLPGSTSRSNEIVQEPVREASVDLDDAINTLEHQFAPRSLRARKPIQLRPYELENERYKHTLKARGIRPVHVVTASQTVSHAQQRDDETQEDSWQQSSQIVGEESQEDIFTFRSSPHSAEPDQGDRSTEDETQPNSHSTQSPVDLQHEHAFLVQKLKHGKRRKISGFSKRAEQIRNKEPTNGDSTEDMGIRSRISIFDIPPSPPESSPPTSTKRLVSLETLKRLQSGITPKKPISPAMSSITRQKASFRDPTTTPDITSSLRSNDGPIEVESEAASSGDESSPSIDDQIQTITKSIKGVLPASWLKIDQKSREEKSGTIDGNDRRLMHQNLEAKGVAKKTFRRTASAVNLPISLPEEDETDHSDTHSKAGSVVLRHQTVRDESHRVEYEQTNLARGSIQDEDPGSDMEDTHIDFMMHSATKLSRKRSTHGHKSSSGAMQQTKLVKSARTGNVVSHATRRLDRHKASSTARQTLAKRNYQQRSRSDPPLLSIMDSAAPTVAGKGVVPPFLRIAMRTSSTRPNLGRQSPSRKYIRLSRREDTADAHSTLRNWRRGRIRPVSPGKSAVSHRRRTPLTEHSNNSLAPPSTLKRMSRISPAQPRSKRALSDAGITTISRTSHPSLTEGSRPSDKDHRGPTRSISNGNRYQFDAQLEDLAQNDENIPRLRYAPAATFHGDTPKRYGSKSNTDLANGQNSLLEFTSSMRNIDTPDFVSGQSVSRTSANTHRPRKLKAKRLEIDSQVYRQTEELDAAYIEPASEDIRVQEQYEPNLRGLKGYGEEYPLFFNVHALPVGTYFHVETFVGSGYFEKSLCMDHRDLNISRGSHAQNLGHFTVTWGQWGQHMQSDVDSAFSSIMSKLEASLDEGQPSSASSSTTSSSAEALRKMIELNVDWLSFADPVDRQDFVRRISVHLDNLLKLSTVPANDLSMCVAMIVQLMQIDQQHAGSSKNALNLKRLLYEASGHLCRTLLSTDVHWLQTEMEKLSDDGQRESGIRDGSKLEGLVVLYHALEHAKQPDHSFWDAFNSMRLTKIQDCSDVHGLENCWREMISILPVLKFDRAGIIGPIETTSTSNDNWQLVKVLLYRVLKDYNTTAKVQGVYINEYVRVLLRRSIYLVNDWGWTKCESVIGTFFDLFASRHFRNLDHETVHGSPRFLQSLSNEPSLSSQPDGTAFQHFLHLMGSGLKAMRKVYPSRKIQSIAWRCIPNHGRTFPKEQSLLESDLEALRNHHDLLCTLYWASPPRHRPQIRLIRSLVDHANSHREVCRINVRSWTNLASYVMHLTDVPLVELDPFAEWLLDIISHNLLQYRQARSEVETSSATDGSSVPGQSTLAFRLSVMSRNQMQVLATLADATAGLKQAIDNASNAETALHLVEKAEVASIFSIFEPSQIRCCALMSDVLEVYAHLHFSLIKFHQKSETSNDSEESQDYGEWPDSQEAVSHVPKKSNIEGFAYIADTVFRFLSNIMGADFEPDDALCLKAIDVWTTISAHQVRDGSEEWSQLISGVTPHSWKQLRSTMQHRKFTSYFVSEVLHADPDTYSTNRDIYLTTWIVSLVERESLLKYQHRLTSAILSVQEHDPLLDNMPFIRSGTSWLISLQHIQERRLSVLSTLLANMHRQYRSTIYKNQDAIRTRQRYSDILKSLMAAMKANFLGLGHQDGVRGAYVFFVQQVVGFLQQYTTDICAVDKFYTDSTAFPLPVDDPTYIIGKLKGYNGRLSDVQAVKKLAIFIQNVSERAAVENQQAYLTGQFAEAMADGFEDGDFDNPSLRSVLLSIIFPIYMQSALQISSGWILALPVIQASTVVFSNLQCHFSIIDDRSRQAVINTLSYVLSTVQASCRLIIDHAGLLEQSSVLLTIRNILAMCISMTPSIDYLIRYSDQAAPLRAAVYWVQDFSAFIAAALVDPATAIEPDEEVELLADDRARDVVMQFCRKELEDSLRIRWISREDQYYIKRGQIQSQVIVDIGTLEEERELLLATIDQLHQILKEPVLFNSTFETLDFLL